MDELVNKIENLVRKLGKEIVAAKQETLKLENKQGIGNIVTQYDQKVQTVLKKELTKILPEAIFIGEEVDAYSNVLDKGYTFVVDPIDGTTNFSRGLSLSAISVALLKDGQPYIGICYNPYADEMFIAQKGKGAYLNGKVIRVSDKKLNEGIVFSGNAPYYEELRQESMETLVKFAKEAADFRRLGSAVIELCGIACGRAEVYFELRLQPWDYAAGMLIVEEAGGKVTTMEGKEQTFNKPNSILASNNMEDYLKHIK